MTRPEHLEPSIAINAYPVPVGQVRHLNLLPSTPWEYDCPATLRYLERQRRRAETDLGLEAVIVRDNRGFLALWTR